MTYSRGMQAYYYLIAPIVIVRNDKAAFTYHSSNSLVIGSIVQIPAGRILTYGVVLEKVSRPIFETRGVVKLIFSKPIPKPLLKTASWISDYYAVHLGLALQTIIPNHLEKTRRRQKTINYPLRERTNILLNNHQLAALEQINTSAAGTNLLHGVTGSGKTQVYIEAAKLQATKNRSSIILVPEIALTPQLVAEFSKHFDNLILSHSAMTEAQRFFAWTKALNSSSPAVIIGPRSALFLPIDKVGLIVVDECHEQTYKQEQSPRYLALRAASVLANHHSAKLILGSATPNVADYFLAKTRQLSILNLPKPAIESAKVDVQIVDLKLRDNFKKHHFLSNALLEQIEKALSEKKQVLLFHNRRGTAPNTICTSCGWVAICQKCFLPLTLHADHHKLICHLCGMWQNITPSCPECSQPAIIFKGIGTKMIENEVSKLFPKATIGRFDADSKQKDALHNHYQNIYDGKIDILVGTQILTKGLDLPHLTVVGIIQADNGLLLPDYQANERVFQLIYQVIGRVGRSKHNGQVVIQTFQPDNPIIKMAAQRDYINFYNNELTLRQKNNLPPFTYLLKMVCSYKTERSAINASQRLAKTLRKKQQVEVLGPTPAFYERLGGNFRWQIIVKSNRRHVLVDIAKGLPSGWQFDLDPLSLL